MASLHTNYYIIEHPTRGVLRDYEAGYGNPGNWIFRFSWSGSRSDEEKVHRFYNLKAARRVLAMMPLKLSGACNIRKSPEFRVVGEIPPTRSEPDIGTCQSCGRYHDMLLMKTCPCGGYIG